jgi:hypothetical protein
MEIEELRIGNLVKNGLGEFIIIKNNINERNTGGYILKTLEPIPLTAEWLVKFGLNQSNSSENYGSEKICVFYNLRSVNIHYSFYGCDYEFECPRYVHQLQNLYFALTGCELQCVA